MSPETIFNSAFRLITILWTLSLSLCSAQSFPVLKSSFFYGDERNQVATCLEVSEDKHLFIAGNQEAERRNGVCTDVLIMKVDTAGEVIWERNVGGFGCDEVRDMIATRDSGVIFTGVTGSNLPHDEMGQKPFYADFFIGKLNKYGRVDWTKKYGGNRQDQAFSISGNDFTGFTTAGVSQSNSGDFRTENEGPNAWGLRFGNNGDMKRTYVFGGKRQDVVYSITQCRNGDFVYVGFTNSEDLDGGRRRTNGDGWIFRTSEYGNIRWQRIFSGKFEEYFTSVVEDNLGRIVVCGNFETENKGKQFWFLKLTEDGKKLQEKIFGGSQDEYATSIDALANGGYLISGYSSYVSLDNADIKGKDDMWVVRLDETGEVVWQKTFGGPENERAVDALEYSPGLFFALGEKVNDFKNEGKEKNGTDYWLLKIEDVPCDSLKVDIYHSLKDHTSYVDKSFKLKALSNADRFVWDFGDGTTSEQRDPVKKYDLKGLYRIKLTGYMNETCKKEYTYPRTIMVW